MHSVTSRFACRPVSAACVLAGLLARTLARTYQS